MEPNEAMKAMARRIASETKVGVATQQILDGLWDNSPVFRAALAAIMETQEACAKVADGWGIEGTEEALIAGDIAAAIRVGHHYALAGECAALSAAIGEDIGGGRG